MSNHSSNTDIELLSRIRDGDEAAFTTLFERHRSRLYYYLLRHTKSPELAEEIVIDIFIKLWEDRELADQIGMPSAFFHKVGYHKAMDFLRTASRSKQLQEAYLRRAVRQTQSAPDELLMDEEARALLVEAVNQLPPQRRLIYRMSREDNMSHERIAEVLNLSRSTINNTIVAATRSISEHLRRHAGGKAALSFLCLVFFRS